MTGWLLVLTAACIAVADDWIRAGDLAAKVPAFASVDPGVVVVPAPPPGASRRLGPEQLRRLGSRLGIVGEISESVCVSRLLVPVERAKVLEAMRASLGGLAEGLELLEVSAKQVPPGEYEFHLSGLQRPPSRQPEAPVLWQGKLRYGAGRSLSVWARVRLKRPCQRLVASRTIPAGVVLRDSDVVVRAFGNCPLDPELLESPESVVGNAVVRVIERGAVIRKSDLAPAAAIVKGDQVQVEVLSGQARIVVQAKAESDGALGAPVRLRNTQSGKVFRATVVGPGKARLEVGGGG